ncbi:DUF3800 domain-containing protein [Bradyrhizobium liaoningense]|uniref:DUF3800 domain-containing protein n=1 Tax=Bradyrhizobium liaoningense TaxID=43992 RepID=UPI001BABA8DF|nr:DUF3800 domain-containing protein [Bradyrhizobium liaoningense]MBR0858624.1 DUF3800 domain-containing protein [Bradyrhizobium liaoningense]
MKFAYLDETGSADQSDVFVMAALLVDAYRLRKYTTEFDRMINVFLEKHPGLKKELKTKRMINGEGGWSEVSADERKEFLGKICDLAKECARVFAIAISFSEFKKAIAASHGQPFEASYWIGTAMFLAGVIQKRMQSGKKNKGLTVLICDDNKREMQNLSDALHAANSWFDPLYQASKLKAGKTVWIELNDDLRFDQIVNTAFAIKSEHSSMIQVADAVAYVYRRQIELLTEDEEWDGEKKYFEQLVGRLPKNERLGRTPGGPCIDFYKAAQHKQWAL